MQTQSFFDSLWIMLYGMCGIFIVTGLIILSMVLLNKLSKKQKEKDS